MSAATSTAKLALEAARKTITLLKNDDSTLPLDAGKVKTIAVIGPNADRELLGGYSGKPKQFIDGARRDSRSASATSIEVLYHEGCKITLGGPGTQINEMTPSDPEDRSPQHRRGGEGGRTGRCGRARSRRQRANVARGLDGLNHLGDRASSTWSASRTSSSTPSPQPASRSSRSLFNGRPLSIRILAEKATAILRVLVPRPGIWPGGGRDVLFGDVNPSGKLPITIPRSVGQLPMYYNYRPSARRGYLFDEVSPLYPFGFGLSYTTFKFGPPRLEQSTIGRDEKTRVLVDVTNTGQRAGDEIVQLYIRDLVSSATRPVKELKGFQRITLQPGETRNVCSRHHARPPGILEHRQTIRRRTRRVHDHDRPKFNRTAIGEAYC